MTRVDGEVSFTLCVSKEHRIYDKSSREVGLAHLDEVLHLASQHCPQKNGYMHTAEGLPLLEECRPEEEGISTLGKIFE
jgi:hypothetical protein